MGLDVYWHFGVPDLTSWESSQRTVVDELWDTDHLFAEAIEKTSRGEFPVLFGIDLYGDTVLNSEQSATALAELARIPGGSENPQVGLVERLLRKCIGTPGMHIAFIGD